MDTNTNKRKIESIVNWAFLLLTPLLFGFSVASAITSYPPGSLLQPNDVTSSHIRDGVILDVDVSGSANISATKIAPRGTANTPLLTDGTNIATTTEVLFDTTTDNTYFFGHRINATSTNFNGVNYTWPSADGTNSYALTTNGSGALSWSSTASGLSLTAATSTAVGDVMALCEFGMRPTAGADSIKEFGGTGSVKRKQLRQSVLRHNLPDSGFSQVSVLLKKAGSPTDNVIISIYDSAFATELASTTVAGTSLTTTVATSTLSLPSVISAQDIVINLRRSGALDDTNYYFLQAFASGDYANSDMQGLDEVNAWGSLGAGVDMVVMLARYGWACRATATEPGWMSNKILGISNSAVAASSTVSVLQSGTIETSAFSLQPISPYYVGNATGTLSHTPGTFSYYIGRSASTTALTISLPTN